MKFMFNFTQVNFSRHVMQTNQPSSDLAIHIAIGLKVTVFYITIHVVFFE